MLVPHLNTLSSLSRDSLVGAFLSVDMSSTHNGSSAGISKAWFSYPTELPQSTDPLAAFPEFRILSDPAFHRDLTSELRSKVLLAAAQALKTDNSAIFLVGGRSWDFELYDSDTDKCEFRQEMFFRYLFPVNEPDVCAALDLTTGESLLFVPEVTDDSQRWNGERRPLSYYTEHYGLSQTYLTNDIHSILQERHIKTLYVLYGQNSDSGLFTKTTIESIGLPADTYTLETTLLHPLLSELRVFKTEREIEIMRLGNAISSQAHVYVMTHIKAGMTEIHAEALFKSYCQYYGGCRHMAYTCICGSGSNGSILHYGHAGRPNDRILKDGDTVVFDMGGEYAGYASDITRSYPINGKFTEDQAAIHTAVYEAQQAVLHAMKPGVSWSDMHRLAEQVIITHLIQIGVLYQGTIEEMIHAHMGAVFMPHGLGHLLGLNVHDVGGYHPGTQRSKEPGLCWLRLGRRLEAGMCLTIEPGIYFNDPTINKALKNPSQGKYINEEVLKRFRGSGGCRLEDNVIVTKDGAENLTVIPATVADIEEMMARAKKQHS